VFISVSHFHLGQIFAGKVLLEWSPLMGLFYNGSLLALPANSEQCIIMWQKVTNALAYCGKQKIDDTRAGICPHGGKQLISWWSAASTLVDGATTFITTAFSIMTPSIKGLFVTLSIATRCHYAECRCAECRDILIVMLDVIMLSVIMLSVVAPYRCHSIGATVLGMTTLNLMTLNIMTCWI
jgi:hypothetical protein